MLYNNGTNMVTFSEAWDGMVSNGGAVPGGGFHLACHDGPPVQVTYSFIVSGGALNFFTFVTTPTTACGSE